MKRQILISALILLSIQTLGAAAVRPVPQQYPTIQSAINACSNGDIVVVDEGVYSGVGNFNLNFHGLAITVQSTTNPADPDPNVIASTIIDCLGDRYHRKRAFIFGSGEGPDSKLIGFTIKNAYWFQHVGNNGTYGYYGDPLSWFIPVSIDPDGDVNTMPPQALNGANKSGNSYGGAIVCQAASSPTIQHCVISNCIITGAQGGDGADGLDGPWEHWTLGDDYPPGSGVIDYVNNVPTENDGGQWGGHGGSGTGNGYGGAIACIGGSSPVISDCIISNNLARGGCGGRGGDGGDAAQEDPPAYDGPESGGGDAGLSIGDGIGGGIYANSTSHPVIINCTFNNNIALTGVRGAGGERGAGSETDPRPPKGLDSYVLPSSAREIAGGAVYLDNGSSTSFINCKFNGNQAHEAYVVYDTQLIPVLPEEDISAYTVGGALFAYGDNFINLINCEFTDNTSGAIYCDTNCVLDINNAYDPNLNCLFTGNSDIDDSNDQDDVLTGMGYPRRNDPGSGGAIFIDRVGSLKIQNGIFTGNSAKNDGGALKSKCDANFTNCLFGNNVALGEDDYYGYGGAVDAYGGSGSALLVDFNSCSFIANQALIGGGLSARNFDSNLINCYFLENTAGEGGGLNLSGGNLFMTNGLIRGNSATDGFGGGLICTTTESEILNCAIMDNSATDNGGAINFYGGFVPQLVKNCLITGNSSGGNGGGISCELFSSTEIRNCTFVDNLTYGFGGAVFTDWSSGIVTPPQITDCIFEGCNGHAIHEDDDGDATVTYSLFYNNSNGDYYDSGTQSIYAGPSIPGGSNNLSGNPLFVSGSLGDYYLSQVAAGQGSDSPAINNGSDTAANLGLDTFTTRTDNVGDSGQVDRGYHYPDSTGLGVFQLTASVVGGHGTIEPTSGTYFMGTVVTLTAVPDAGWDVDAWTGTDNDSSTDLTNTVVMYADRVVTVSFRQPAQTITVGCDGDFPTIEAALSVAEDGDTIIVCPGTYYGPARQINKSVTIRSQDPNHPEDTIIDGTAYVDRAFYFGPDTDSGTILDGFTIQNCRWQWGQADPPEPCPGLNGLDGGNVVGGAIVIYPDASPVIKNCIIRENTMRGGDASDGCGATEAHNAGRGGWGGLAYGGGIYCGENSRPKFINCQIVNNHAGGGNGGDGGDQGDEQNGLPNYGGNWSAPSSPYVGDILPPWPDIHPEDLTWEVLPVGMGLWEAWGYFDDYRWYSAYGGGVFCDEDSVVTFIDCTISGNRTSGGMSGEGGLFAGQVVGDNELEPEISFQLPSFGGGVYCYRNSIVTFTRCTITDNVSVRPDADLDAYFNPAPDSPQAWYHLDPYIGHGGGVCAERTATIIFNDCIVSENKASLGGGVYWKDANVKLVDSDIISNIAYNGGGLYGGTGPAIVIGCDISDNEAFGEVTDPNGENQDPNVYDPNNNYYLPGSGGGIYCDSALVQIADTSISGNEAGASGGGVYLSGPNSPVLFNCLITDNRAGKEGGGISANFLSQLTISVSTIAGNLVLGTDFPMMLGGGLYSADGANTTIFGSILWGNYSAGPGDQIAIDESPSPSTVSVTYSDVQGGATGVSITPGCTLLWDDVNNLTGTVGDPLSEPLFVTGRQGGYYLSQPDANAEQTELSPCVDAGDGNALDLDLYRHTTRTDEMLDALVGSGIVDMGYHYILTSGIIGDFDFDGEVTIIDLEIFLEHWLEFDCQFPDWCHGTDLNQDGKVDNVDYAIFTSNYKETETEAPEPNPMTWDIPPVSAGPSAIVMVATTATDNSGTDVEYYFDCVYGNCHDLGWDPCSTYIDTSLTKGDKYGYRVKARDTSANLNETDWSFIGYAIPTDETSVEDDHNPPTPDPMTWATAPYGLSTTSIRMVATTAVDDTSGVEYYFENYDSNVVNSGWQSSSTWTDTGLTPETTYNYRVRARDTSPWHNQTDWSTVLGATTLGEGQEPNDPNDPNQPQEDNTAPLPNPSQWADGGEPSMYYENGYWWHSMTAEPTSDATTGGSEPVEYYFELVAGGYGPHSSGWQTSNEYTYQVSSLNPQYGFYRVRARDGVLTVPNDGTGERGNKTAWSVTLEAD